LPENSDDNSTFSILSELLNSSDRSDVGGLFAGAQELVAGTTTSATSATKCEEMGDTVYLRTVPEGEESVLYILVTDTAVLYAVIIILVGVIAYVRTMKLDRQDQLLRLAYSLDVAHAELDAKKNELFYNDFRTAAGEVHLLLMNSARRGDRCATFPSLFRLLYFLFSLLARLSRVLKSILQFTSGGNDRIQALRWNSSSSILQFIMLRWPLPACHACLTPVPPPLVLLH
jgi:hypothetical protein